MTLRECAKVIKNYSYHWPAAVLIYKIGRHWGAIGGTLAFIKGIKQMCEAKGGDTFLILKDGGGLNHWITGYRLTDIEADIKRVMLLGGINEQ